MQVQGDDYAARASLAFGDAADLTVPRGPGEDADETDDLLAATGWRVVPSPPAHAPAQRLGPVRLLVLEPLAGS